MSYRILIYCPDRHLVYEGSTPDRKGVGGGVVARIRLAEALARLGHQVTVVGNVPRRHVYQRVTYIPLDTPDLPRQVDVLLLTSSGGALSLEPARELKVEARLREVWVHGTKLVAGVGEAGARYVVGVSNFIRRVMLEEWGLPREQLFVIHNGANELPLGRPPKRDPFSLIYTGHPAKGLAAARGVLRLLRQHDPRYTLHVYGGNALWGGQDEPPAREAGVAYHGLVGQTTLVKALAAASFALHLQTIQEAFSVSLLDALRYGAIPIASPVGGHLEAIAHGTNGFLVRGDPDDESVQRRVAELILALNAHPAFQDYMRSRAQAVPWTWDRQARTWETHWAQALGQGSAEANEVPLLEETCPECGGGWLYLADGYHCARCGLYRAGGPAVPEARG